MDAARPLQSTMCEPVPWTLLPECMVYPVTLVMHDGVETAGVPGGGGDRAGVPGGGGDRAGM